MYPPFGSRPLHTRTHTHTNTHTHTYTHTHTHTYIHKHTHTLTHAHTHTLTHAHTHTHAHTSATFTVTLSSIHPAHTTATAFPRNRSPLLPSSPPTCNHPFPSHNQLPEPPSSHQRLLRIHPLLLLSPPSPTPRPPLNPDTAYPSGTVLDFSYRRQSRPIPPYTLDYFSTVLSSPACSSQVLHSGDARLLRQRQRCAGARAMRRQCRVGD